MALLPTAGGVSSPRTTVRPLIRQIQRVLTPDLLLPKWRKLALRSGHPLYGHCYAASEAAYHLLGGSKYWQSCVLSHSSWPKGMNLGRTHWFIRDKKPPAATAP